METNRILFTQCDAIYIKISEKNIAIGDSEQKKKKLFDYRNVCINAIRFIHPKNVMFIGYLNGYA